MWRKSKEEKIAILEGIKLKKLAKVSHYEQQSAALRSKEKVLAAKAGHLVKEVEDIDRQIKGIV